MRARQLSIRALADSDARTAAEGYADVAGRDVALRFVARLQDVYSAIARAPGTGSSRWAHELSVPGLRSKRIKGFPWAAFYIVQDDRIDVLRVLDLRTDIPAWLRLQSDTEI